MSHAFELACAGVLLAGCVDVPRDAPAPGEAGSCEVPEQYEVLPTGSIVEGDIIVGKIDELRAACAAGRAWHPYGLPGTTRGHGVLQASLWPNGVIPYEPVDPDVFPRPDRIADAIAYWNATNTPITLVERTNETNYIRFVNGNSCSSPVGRLANGPQDIELSTSKPAGDIVGSALSSTSHVYTWYADGMVSSGSAFALDSERVQYRYNLPGGYTTAMIRGIDIRKSDDHVFVWYSDGKVSEGRSDDLDFYEAPVDYDVPTGKTENDILEIAIDNEGDVFTWFDDGTTAIGVTTDLGSVISTNGFTAPYARTTIRGMTMGWGNEVYTWYSNSWWTVGVRTILDDWTAPAKFAPPGDCAGPQIRHEIGHAVGLHHEQTRCDRDDDVQVYWNNIQAGKSSNFSIQCIGNAQEIGDYDLISLMHYDSCGFSTSSTCGTLVDHATMLAHNSAGAPVAENRVVDMSIDINDRVYTWWTDGMVTVGRYDDLERYESRVPYTVPGGRPTSDIVGIGILRSTGVVHTYFRDGRLGIGTPTNLDTDGALGFFSVPGVLNPQNIVAVDFNSTGNIYAWYITGQRSVGTSTTNLGSTLSNFTFPTGQNWGLVLGIAITPTDLVRSWYANGETSGGTSTDLDATLPLFDFQERKRRITASDFLTAGDLAAVNFLY